MHVIAVRYVGWRFLSLLVPRSWLPRCNQTDVLHLPSRENHLYSGRGSFAATLLVLPQTLVTIAQLRLRFQL